MSENNNQRKLGSYECGECSACCYLFSIPKGEGVEKEKDKWCQYYKEKKGCQIYKNRPAICSNFSCFWIDKTWRHMLQMKEEHRPDRSGVLLINNLFLNEILVLSFVEFLQGAISQEWCQKLLRDFSRAGLPTLQVYLNGEREVIASRGSEALCFARQMEWRAHEGEKYSSPSWPRTAVENSIFRSIFSSFLERSEQSISFQKGMRNKDKLTPFGSG